MENRCQSSRTRIAARPVSIGPCHKDVLCPASVSLNPRGPGRWNIGAKAADTRNIFAREQPFSKPF